MSETIDPWAPHDDEWEWIEPSEEELAEHRRRVETLWRRFLWLDTEAKALWGEHGHKVLADALEHLKPPARRGRPRGSHGKFSFTYDPTLILRYDDRPAGESTLAFARREAGPDASKHDVDRIRKAVKAQDYPDNIYRKFGSPVEMK